MLINNKIITSAVLFCVSFGMAEVTKISTDTSHITEIINILAQVVVIIYAIISLLKESPINWTKVLSKIREALVLLLKVFKFVKKNKKKKDVSSD